LRQVAAEVSKGIAAVAGSTSVPFIFGVLTTDTMQQPLELAGIKSNLGGSYGLQSLEMGNLVKVLPPLSAMGFCATIAAALAWWADPGGPFGKAESLPASGSVHDGRYTPGKRARSDAAGS
jgi:hypothetical protein